MIPIILSGGSGSRLWPLSRAAYPKQYLRLCSERSMVLDTIGRLADSVADVPPIFVTAEEQRFLLAEQLRKASIDAREIILEPARRNTAPAIALACFRALEESDNPVVLVLPSDHHIKDEVAFRQALIEAERQANDGMLVTFGVVADKPETGYGYIKANITQEAACHSIAEFVEKPTLEVAERYLKEGCYFWNSGMFAFRADVYLSELERCNHDIFVACQSAWRQRSADLDFVRVGYDAFCDSPEDSIDYAVMEQTDKGVVIPIECGWSDVGSWQSLWDFKPKDANGNVLQGSVVAVDTRESMVISDSRLVTCLGVENLVVVESADAILVADINKVQEVKNIVSKVKDLGGAEHEFHREVHRPWGRFDSVDEGERYKVKRITVEPGQKLSVQWHHHRAEHWVVVQGTAKVHKGSESMLLSENESVYIPIGEVHALENPGKIPLEIIEIQTGAYLGEDDIVRRSDNYGRSSED